MTAIHCLYYGKNYLKMYIFCETNIYCLGKYRAMFTLYTEVTKLCERCKKKNFNASIHAFAPSLPFCRSERERVFITRQIQSSQWPSGLRRGCATDRLLRLRVRIPTMAWMFVCCECCVFVR
jgi:hypothetical protein